MEKDKLKNGLNKYYKKRLLLHNERVGDRIHEKNGRIYVFYRRGKNEWDKKPYIYDNWTEAANEGYNII